jgi:hypothetical protein
MNEGRPPNSSLPPRRAASRRHGHTANQRCGCYEELPQCNRSCREFVDERQLVSYVFASSPKHISQLRLTAAETGCGLCQSFPATPLRSVQPNIRFASRAIEFVPIRRGESDVNGYPGRRRERARRQMLSVGCSHDVASFRENLAKSGAVFYSGTGITLRRTGHQDVGREN